MPESKQIKQKKPIKMGVELKTDKKEPRGCNIAVHR